MVMIRLEEQTKKKARRRRIQDKITLAIFRFTVQGGLAFAPESYLRKRLGLPEAKPAEVSRRMRQAMQRLQKRGLVEWKKEGKDWRARLTERGKVFAGKVESAERLRIRKPEHWDEKWRVVIFDVREKYKTSRDRFRRILQKAGFFRLQDSVWVHPYDCEELVVFMRKELKLGGSVLYLIAEGVENDAKLCEFFGL